MNTTDMIKFNVHIDWPADVQMGIFPLPAATIYILKENEIKKNNTKYMDFANI